MFELPRAGMNGEPKPDAYDPDKNPECFEGVLPRRIVAFCIDAVLIVGTHHPARPFHFRVRPRDLRSRLVLVLDALAGLRDLGDSLCRDHARLTPFGHDRHAHARFGIAYLVRRPDVFPARRRARDLFLDFGEHAESPLILFVALVNRQHRLLHDFLTGTVMINNAARANTLRRPGKA